MVVGFLFRCNGCFQKVEVSSSNLNDATKELRRQGWSNGANSQGAVHTCPTCRGVAQGTASTAA